jgi:hypothetical protein
MRKRLLLPTLAASLLTAASSNAALVSLYTLDDTSGGVAVDSVGGNDATWQNGSTNLANAAGQMGGAANMTDSGAGTANNYFQMMLPELIGANALSISAWVNNDGNNGYTGVVMTRTFNGATNNSWGVAIEPDASSWHFDSRVNGPGIDSPAGTIPIDGNWSHLVLVWDGNASTHTQYLNGVQSNSGASIAGPIAGPNSGPWYIGYDDCCGGGRDFDGLFDDISIWDHALSASEVSTIYNNGVAGVGVPEPGVTVLGLLGGLLLLRRRR